MTIEEKRLAAAAALLPNGPVVEFESSLGNKEPFELKNGFNIPFKGVKINCGACTRIHKVTPDTVTASFVIPKNLHLFPEESKELQEKGVITKEYKNFFFIYYQDDKEEFFFNKNRIHIDNPEKLWVKVDMKAKVKIFK
jgi:hypothetical protein